MDNDLQELYQEIILEHNRNPHNKVDNCIYPTCAEGYNPSCGDQVKVCLGMCNDIIENICFSGEGCAISQASASLMTDILKGKTKKEALFIIKEICSALNGEILDLEKYGDVCALAGVKKFPMRIKCATLAWHATKAALEKICIL